MALRSLPVTLLLLTLATNVLAQGVVRERDPRRPPPLEETAGCNLWTGYIPGNDPTAEATVQLCTTGETVTGVFLWSSLQAGWDRRSLTGTWSPDRMQLTLRDTAMLESHPANGWSLCTADRYDLRVMREGHLEGTYVSTPCTDHGRLTLTLRGPSQGPIAPPRAAVRVAPDVPAHRTMLGCSSAPGRASGTSGVWVVLGVGVLLGRARQARGTARRRSAGRCDQRG